MKGAPSETRRSPSQVTTLSTTKRGGVGSHQYEYESVFKLTPKHSKIFAFGAFIGNSNQYSLPFSNFCKSDLHHGAAFLTDNAQLTLVYWRARTKRIISNDNLLIATLYIYIYIIKHNRHFMSTYFLLDPFEFPYYFYRIRWELIYVLSIVVCIPSTFCPTLGHHQGRIYYKSDVTFVLAYYYCVRASLLLALIIEFHLKANAIIFNGKDALTQ